MRGGELAQVGELRVTAYQAGGFLSAKSEYEPVLRALGAAQNLPAYRAAASVG